jgi:hypothetical protein
MVTGEGTVSENIHQQIALIEIYQTMYYMCTFKLILRSFPSITQRTEKVEVDVRYLGRLICDSREIFISHSENNGKKCTTQFFSKPTFNFFLQLYKKVAILSYILVYEELCSMNIV